MIDMSKIVTDKELEEKYQLYNLHDPFSYISKTSIFADQAYHDKVFHDNSFPHFDFETLVELASKNIYPSIRHLSHILCKSKLNHTLNCFA